MREIPIKEYVPYVFGIATGLFVLNKLILRPWILENDIGGSVLTVSMSLPNFIEAVAGTLLITGIFLQMRLMVGGRALKIPDTAVHLAAVIAAGIYSIAQELKFHNIGGNNICDPNDLAATGLGLALTYFMIGAFGFMEKPDIRPEP